MGLSREDLEKLAATLKQRRDELKLKIHLAKADAHDEWNRLENQWEDIRLKMEAVRKEAGQTAGGVSTALETALEEIRKGYDRIRNIL